MVGPEVAEAERAAIEQHRGRHNRSTRQGSVVVDREGKVSIKVTRGRIPENVVAADERVDVRDGAGQHDRAVPEPLTVTPPADVAVRISLKRNEAIVTVTGVVRHRRPGS
jgi:hypothetical protein